MMAWTIEQRRAWQRAYNRRNPERVAFNQRTSVLRRKFKMTYVEYEKACKEQNDVCYICYKTNPNGYRLAVDHNHETNRVRKMLCSRCNKILGQAEENPDLLRKMAAYLEEHLV